MRYSCDRCDRKFANKQKLEKHKDGCESNSDPNKSGDQNYECEDCGKQFDSKAAVNGHKASCGPNTKRYSCDHCIKRFETQRKLKVHEKSCQGKSKNPASYGKEITWRGGERVTGKNPFADTSKLKDAGLHQGGG
jgi:DNA-directed RNA polymerase subunit RPC12/RpoP